MPPSARLLRRRGRFHGTCADPNPPCPDCGASPPPITRARCRSRDADIQSWYDGQPSSSYQVPDQVQAQYVVLDEAAASVGIKVSDDDIAKYYEQNKCRFGQPERRRASHIMIQVAPERDRRAAPGRAPRADDIAKQAAAHPGRFRRAGPQGVRGRRLGRPRRGPGLGRPGCCPGAGAGRRRAAQGPGLRRDREPAWAFTC